MVDPLTSGLVAGGVKGLGSLIGGLFSGSAEREARDIQTQAIDQAIKDLQAQGVPPAEALNVVYEKFASAGTLTPEMEQTFQAKKSEMEGVQFDKGLREKRMAALDALSERGTVGMTAEERAEREALLQDAAAVGASGLRNVEAQEAARGNQGGSSGASLALRAAAAQNAGNQAATQARNLSSDMSKRALESILQSGNLAGQLEADTLGLDTKKAEAMDIINKYNIQNQQNVAGRNVGTRNSAQASNLANAQDVLNQNTTLTNREKDIASQNKAAEFKAKSGLLDKVNELNQKKAGIKAGASRGENAAAAGMAGGALDALGTGYGAYTAADTAASDPVTASKLKKTFSGFYGKNKNNITE